MTHLVERNCIEMPDTSIDVYGRSTRPLAEFRELPAYVLLGDPGMGKTTSLQMEAEATDGHFVSARDFVCLSPSPEWRKRTLFIDGLDEIRVGCRDGRQALDKIRKQLDALGRPNFRLSCRTVGWFGSNDRKHLAAVTPDSRLRVLMLAPLTEQDIRSIVTKNHNCKKALDIQELLGIADLATNPLNLKLLCEAWKLGLGRIPRTRNGMMMRACETLLKEKNEEHISASECEMPNLQRLMEVARHLSALLVLTSARAMAIHQGDQPDVLSLYNLPEASMDMHAARRVLDSRLFAALSERAWAPVHRQISEFLAAKYVAERLQAGTPLRRLCVLVTGYDGKLLPEFYGFAGLLADLSRLFRDSLIEREPAVVVSESDFKAFEEKEKQRLLHSLLREARSNPSRLDMLLSSGSFQGLATGSVAKEAVKLLAALKPTENCRYDALVLSEVLRNGDVVPGAAGRLLGIVGDASWNYDARMFSLRAAWKQVDAKDGGGYDRFVNLAADIFEDRIPDDLDLLLGFLLKRLYPDVLSTGEIIKFLRTPKARAQGRAFFRFWASHVPWSSSETQLTEILDALVDRHGALKPDEESMAKTLQEAVLSYLAVYLERFKEHATAEKLYGWLRVSSLALAARTYEFGVRQSDSRIREFLASSLPELRKKLETMHGLHDNDSSALSGDPRRFWAPRDSQGFTKKPLSPIGVQEAKEFIRAYAKFLEAEGESESVVASVVDEANALEGASKSVPLTEIGRQVQDLFNQSRQERRADGETQTGPLLPVAMLSRLAIVFLGKGGEATGTTMVARLQNLIGHDDELVNAVRHDFHQAAFALDAPDEQEVLRCIERQEEHLMALPCIAGFADAASFTGTRTTLDDTGQARRAAALYFFAFSLLPPAGLVFGSFADREQWFNDLCEKQPQLVADVYLRYVPVAWKASEYPPAWIDVMTHNDRFSGVAERVVIPLLSKLPVRSGHMDSLVRLLLAALRIHAPQELQDVVREKTAATSMHMQQRAYWLAAGLFVAPERYVEKVDSFARKGQKYRELLAGAITSVPRNVWAQSSPEVLELMVQLIGPHCSSNGSTVLLRSEARSVVREALGTLASQPSEESEQMLSNLALNPELTAWHGAILTAAENQRTFRRAEEFRSNTVEEVSAVLTNGRPMSAADLAVLTADLLQELAEQIRSGSTSDWRQYWNVDSNGRVTNPKPELACRDALASDLDLRLRCQNASIHTESRHADEKRSDMLVSSNGFRVPVEVKKSDSRDLWTGIERQLIPRYANDPAADGFGIYLVFWFGNEPKAPKANPQGSTPESAEALKRQLNDRRPVSDSHKIYVVVVDVAKPRDHE